MNEKEGAGPVMTSKNKSLYLTKEKKKEEKNLRTVQMISTKRRKRKG